MPVQHAEPLRADEVRGVADAEIAIHLGEDHVQVDGGVLLRHHDDDDVGDAGLREQQLREVVDRAGAGTLAEADQHQVIAEGVHVASLERVVQPTLHGPVVEDALVAQQRVVEEERLHDQLFRPADAVPHRADEHVAPHAHRRVAGEEEVGERRQLVAELVERPRERPWPLHASFDEHGHELGRRQRLDLAGQWLARDDVHRLAHEELADLAVLQHLGQEVAHLVHLAEPLEHGGEAAVLDPRPVRVREVVVEVVLARGRRDAEQLVARGVDDDGAQASDLRGDVDGHRTRR